MQAVANEREARDQMRDWSAESVRNRLYGIKGAHPLSLVLERRPDPDTEDAGDAQDDAQHSAEEGGDRA